MGFHDRFDLIELVHLVIYLLTRLPCGRGDAVGRLVQQVNLLVPVDVVPLHDGLGLIDHAADELVFTKQLLLEAIDVLSVEPTVGGHVLQPGCIHLRDPG